MLDQTIKKSLSEPAALERLYRQNPPAFTSAFLSIYEEIRDQPVAETWHERLVYSHEELAWGQRSDWAFLGIGCWWRHFSCSFQIFWGFRMMLIFLEMCHLLCWQGWEDCLRSNND